jgi:hypothetical protein
MSTWMKVNVRYGGSFLGLKQQFLWGDLCLKANGE